MSVSRNLHPFPLSSLQAQRERKNSSNNRNGMKSDERIIFNVGGYRHEIMASTLAFAPETRLYWATQKKAQSPDYDPNTDEFFFDRNPLWFPYILNYYRLGKIHCPTDVCGSQFEEELQYWGIDESVIDSCCWDSYRKHKEADLNLQTLNPDNEESGQRAPLPDIENQLFNQNFLEREVESMPEMSAYGYVENQIRRYKPAVWTTLEDPNSSQMARIYAFLSMFFIIISVSTFCLETLEYFEDPKSVQHKFLYVIETLCVIWFSFELIARFAVCPNKVKFVKNIMNWIDLCAVVPFFVSLVFSNKVKTIVVLRIIRLIRVFRILKLSRHSYGLQILGHTLKASCRELCLLVFFLTIGIVIFSSLIYYAEKETPDSKFTSIPSSFWWSIVTMTTIGYGDMVPTTLSGKLVGALCALCGVLVIALPVPVIVSNFSLYYSHAQSKLRAKDGKKSGKEKKEVLKMFHPWFNPGVTNRSSVVSIVSRNSFYVTSPAPGTPARLSPTYRGSFMANNFLRLRNNSMPNTPLHSPSLIYDYQNNLSPLHSRRNSLSPKICKSSLSNIFKFSNNNISSFNYENSNSEKKNNSKKSDSKTYTSSTNSANNLMDYFYNDNDHLLSVAAKKSTKEKLTINVHPPSCSDSETGTSTEHTDDIESSNLLEEIMENPLSVTSCSSIKEDAIAFQFPSSSEMVKELNYTPLDTPDFNINQHLSPLSFHSPNMSSTSVSPLSGNSVNVFDYNSSYAGSYYSTADNSRKGSSSSTTNHGNDVLRLGEKYSRSTNTYNQRSMSSSSRHYDPRKSQSYPSNEQTFQLQEVSNKLENYLRIKNKRRNFSFSLSPLERSTIHARRKISKSSLSNYYYTSSCSSSLEDSGLYSPHQCSPASLTSPYNAAENNENRDYTQKQGSSIDTSVSTPCLLTAKKFDFDHTKLADAPKIVSVADVPKSPKVFLKPASKAEYSSPCFLVDSSFVDSKQSGKTRSDTVINISSLPEEEQTNIKLKHEQINIKRNNTSRPNRYRKYNSVQRNSTPVDLKIVHNSSNPDLDITKDKCTAIDPLFAKRNKSTAIDPLFAKRNSLTLPDTNHGYRKNIKLKLKREKSKSTPELKDSMEDVYLT